MDLKPNNWEHRVLLFAAYLIKEGKQSATVKSYILAIRAVLANVNVELREDMCLLKSLTRACKLNNDKVRIRMPIQRELLNIILRMIQEIFEEKGQCYLAHLYLSLTAVTYFGLF